ncbi:MAG: AAA family ATPase [Deltaproteobacteria bacterium]|nr:AAA family ATPase [Deltaproteobacteria bacterium]
MHNKKTSQRKTTGKKIKNDECHCVGVPASHYWCTTCSRRSRSFLEQMNKVKAPLKKNKLKARSSFAQPITEIAAPSSPRLLLDLPALDEVIGGGVVEGGVYLLGGEPGVGKSTLLMQIAQGFLLQGKRVLYVSAEEGLERARERGERLGVLDDELLVCTETKLRNVLTALKETKADVLLLDSIQRIHDDKLVSLAGSSQQVRHVCERMLNEKNKKVTLFVVGHVTMC